MVTTAKTTKPSLFSNKTRFSSHQLLIFAVVFGLIGGYVLWRAFAASPTVATVQAEQLSLPAGAAVVSDSLASGGQAVKFTSVGTATGSVSLPSAGDSLTIVAKAAKCKGISPILTFGVDGTTVLTANVTSTSWTSYNLTKSLSSGSHNLSVAYSGATKNRCTPVLYSDVITFFGPAPPPPAVPTVSLSASPTSLSAGAAATLTWSSTSASSCSASGAWSGTQATSGSTSTGPLSATSTYSLACTGVGGTASASATVVVNATTTPPSPPTVYLNPLSQTYGVNSTFTVEVRENSGTTAVNAVQANFSYPTDKITFVSVDVSSSAFPTSAQATGGNGQVSIAQGIIGTLTGDQLVAKVTFKTNAITGLASLPFVTGTSLLSSATNTNLLGSLTATGTGNYTIQ